MKAVWTVVYWADLMADYLVDSTVVLTAERSADPMAVHWALH